MYTVQTPDVAIAAHFEFVRPSESKYIWQRKQLAATGCTVALKMVSEVLSGKEAAADVRSNLKKVVDKLKVKM